MTASELVTAYRQDPAARLPELQGCFRFAKWLDVYVGIPTDLNQDFRLAVTEALLPDFSLADRPLILSLFAEEMKCELATWHHDALYQLCFYLYELRQLEDCFILYDAKFNARNMDVGVSLDRELMTVGHELPEVIAYVEATFASHPALQATYPGILAALHDLQATPDYASMAEYGAGLRRYFQPAPASSAPAFTLSQYQARPRPWWKFWQ